MPYKPYVHGPLFGRMRFDPPHQGVRTKTAKVIRHEYVGGSIYEGRLRVCDYRAPKIFDNCRAHRKHMGDRVQIMRRWFGRREQDELLAAFECNSQRTE